MTIMSIRETSLVCEQQLPNDLEPILSCARPLFYVYTEITHKNECQSYAWPRFWHLFFTSNVFEKLVIYFSFSLFLLPFWTYVFVSNMVWIKPPTAMSHKHTIDNINKIVRFFSVWCHFDQYYLIFLIFQRCWLKRRPPKCMQALQDYTIFQLACVWFITNQNLQIQIVANAKAQFNFG